MDKLVKLSMDHKKLSRSINDMKGTLKGLIKEVNAMECKSISEQLNAIIARINGVENNLHDKNDMIHEAASLIYESEMKLQSLVSDLKGNQFVRQKEMEETLEWSNWTMVAVSIASAILGGCIVALAV